MKKNVVSFMNMKGGVCKTTLCANIANTLASQFNKNVLLIDMDPQFNATQYIFGVLFGSDMMDVYQGIKQEAKTVYSLFVDNDEDEIENADSFNGLFNTSTLPSKNMKKNCISNVRLNFDMIVGDVEILEMQINQKSGAENLLANYIFTNDLTEKYDYILIDCPPTYSFYFISSYLASDTYLIPLKPDFVSSIGLGLLKRAIKQVFNSYQKDLPSLGIVYTLIDPRNTIHISVIDDIEKKMEKKYIFQTKVRYLKAIPDGVNTGNFMLDIQDQGISSDIIKITEEFMARMGEVQ